MFSLMNNKNKVYLVNINDINQYNKYIDILGNIMRLVLPSGLKCFKIINTVQLSLKKKHTEGVASLCP